MPGVIYDWSTTAASNTTVEGIGINTNMSIADIDNAFRAIMTVCANTLHSDLQTFLAGSATLTVAKGGTGAATLTGILKGNGTSAVTAITIPTDTNTVKYLRTDGTFTAPKESFIVKATDDSTALTATTGLGYFDIPYDFTASSVVASLATAQASGSTLTVDVNKNGTSILSTKITIDNTETSSLTAAVAAVLSTTSFTAGDRVTIDVDAIGDGTAKGLTVTLIGRQA